MSSQQPVPASEDATPRKRRKTQVACSVCRARKTGCDARRPHCTSCVTRGWQERCSYQDTVSQSPALALLDLEHRLRKLEDGTSRQTEATSSAKTPSAAEASPSAVGSHTQNSTWELHDRSILPRLDRHHIENDIPVHADRANHAFVNQIASVAEGLGDSNHLGIGQLSRTEDEGMKWSGLSQSKSGSGLKNFVLTPRYLADGLLEWYWNFIHPLLPVLHRPTFTADYNKLWQQERDCLIQGIVRNAVFYGILNMVLALGCQRNEQFEPEERESLGEEFYKRSVNLVSLDNLDESSLPVVQLLILRGLYLLYSPYAGRCWNVAGVAIRVAQAIGLDTANFHSISLNQLTREMRRRIWYSCVILDRLTATSFRRPLLLPRTFSIPFPAEVDDEYLSPIEEGRQPNAIPSRLAYLTHSLRLTDIENKWRELEEQHAQEGKEKYSARELGTIVDIHTELDRYHEQLPDHLQPGAIYCGPASPNCFELQANVLQARIIYLKLRILGPFLLAEVRTTIKESTAQDSVGKSNLSEELEQRLRDDVSRLCVLATHDVLEELHRRLSSVQRTSPWHALFFTFAAASILVAATLCPSLAVDLDQEPAKSSWTRATQIFEFHSQHVLSVEKGVIILEAFRKTVAARKGMSEETNLLGRNTQENSSYASNLGRVSFASIPSLDEQSNYELLDLSSFMDSTSLDLSWITSQDLIFDELVGKE